MKKEKAETENRMPEKVKKEKAENQSASSRLANEEKFAVLLVIIAFLLFLATISGVFRFSF